MLLADFDPVFNPLSPSIGLRLILSYTDSKIYRKKTHVYIFEFIELITSGSLHQWNESVSLQSNIAKKDNPQSYASFHRATSGDGVVSDTQQ